MRNLGETAVKHIAMPKEGSTPPMIPARPPFGTGKTETPCSEVIMGLLATQKDKCRILFVHTDPTENGTFVTPAKDVILSYHLVMTTVENALVLSMHEMYGDFTHIFVDEAGQ
ncbi:hypothetical protein RRG08_046043, partial [Elysia crispata]